MKRILLGLTLIFSCYLMYGQIQVSGVVKSYADNLPLPGANVIVKGTTNGTITDIDGKYQISVENNDVVLVFSFMGYENQEVTINGRSVINIDLLSDVVSLTELVVVGYGTQKKADLTSAIATLNPKEIVKMPGGATEALQGTVAGVNVSAGAVRIRGVSSITGDTEPLWVVDGLIGGSVPNENEIESMQILKDAASCAIYGVRGANGVIIVTTKKGKAGEPVVEYNGYGGTGMPWNMLEMMNAKDYGEYVHELFYNYYGDGYLSNVPANSLEPNSPLADSDWQKEFFQRSYYHKHNISVSGGTENMSFRTGVTYSGNRNSIIKSGSESKGLYSNVTFTKKWFTFGQNSNFSLYDSYSGDGSFFDMLRQPSNIPIYTASDTISHGYYITGTNADGNDMINQIARLNLIKNKTRNLNMKGNVFAEINFFKLIKYKFNLGYDFYDQHTLKDRPAYNIGKEKFDVDYLKENTTRTSRYVFDNLITFDKSFGDHSVGVMAGLSYETAYSRSFGAEGEKDVISKLTVLNQYLANNTVSGSVYEDKMFSYLARVTYSFKGKYLLTGNVRRDGSSNFAKENQWGIFPSISAGWRISDEDFFRDRFYFVDNMKLRATLGHIGNQKVVSRYSYNSYVISDNQYYTFGQDQANQPAPIIKEFSNRGLGWETIRDAGFGFDLDMFKNKVNIIFDYYNKLTKDVILARQMPLSSGTSEPVNVNAGEVLNTGVELAVTYRGQSGDFKWTVTPTASFNRNKVIDIGDFAFQGGDIGTDFVTLTKTGSTVGEFYGYKTDGVFKSIEEVNAHADGAGNLIQPAAKPGDLKFLDLNNNGRIDDGDKTVIGTPIPVISGGINFTAEWKGIDFSMLWTGDYGNDIYNNGKALVMHGISPVNQSVEMLDRFRAEDITLTTPSGDVIFLAANTDTDVPRCVNGDPNGNMSKVSDYFVEDGSYLRLKRVTIGYTLPKQALSVIGFDEVRFYVGAKNPLTFTKYSMFDPEVSGMAYEAGGAQINRGIDFQKAWGSTNAVLREFYFGLQLKF